MKCFVGIDLGSTTTKAVVLDKAGAVLGRGITNSRSNYDTASRVSKLDAFLSTRLTLFRRGLEEIPESSGKSGRYAGGNGAKFSPGAVSGTVAGFADNLC